MISWEDAVQGFSIHLQLEKSLSSNSIEAYLRDIEKLQTFSLSNAWKNPLKLKWRM